MDIRCDRSSGWRIFSVTTGSYAGALEVPVATPLSVQFGDLGEIHLQLVAV